MCCERDYRCPDVIQSFCCDVIANRKPLAPAFLS